MKLKLGVLLVVCFLFVSCAVSKKGSKSNSIASMMAQGGDMETYTFVGEIYPPFFFQGKDGEARGQDVDILNQVAKQLGVKFNYKFLDWDEAQKKSAEGVYDGILTLSKTKDREKKYYFPRVNTSLDEVGIFASPTFRGEIRDLHDLRGLRVGVVKGFHYSDEFEAYKNCTKIEAKNSYELFNWVLKGSIRLALTGIKPGKYLLEFQALTKFKEYADMIKQIKIMPIIFQADPLYIAIPKKLKRGRELNQRIDNALLKMQNTGELFKIKQKYN